MSEVSASEDQLDERFAAGDQTAVEAAYREHGTLIYSLCRRALGDEVAAEVTQDVFLAAWQSHRKYSPQHGSLAGWLVGIARFKIIDRQRAQYRTVSTDATVDLTDQAAGSPTVGGVDASQIDRIAERMVIAEALRVLPERSRKMVELAFFDDLSHQEISERCEVPLGTVKSDIRRGIERLRRHLEGFDHAVRS